MLISVIVPIYRQWNLAAELLRRIEAQSLPADMFEVLLVDNGSPDFSPPEPLPTNVRILRCMTPGSYAARNEGVRHARGEWLAFTDGDCRPDPDWLTTLLSVIRRHDDDRVLFAGAVDVVSPSARPNAYEIFDMVGGIPQARYVSRGYGATANLTFSRRTFDSVGGFDASRLSGGDADFCRRAGALGHPIVFVAEAKVEHPARATWRELATKARRVKGGQLLSGPWKRRLMWTAATVVAPLRNGILLMRVRSQPFHYRLIAAGVMLRLWIVEVGELIRLGLGGKPERS